MNQSKKIFRMVFLAMMVAIGVGTGVGINALLSKSLGQNDRERVNQVAGMLVLDALGLKPLICAEMCLGEGTGAVAAMPLLAMALAVYDEMRTFEEIDVAAYTPQS